MGRPGSTLVEANVDPLVFGDAVSRLNGLVRRSATSDNRDDDNGLCEAALPQAELSPAVMTLLTGVVELRPTADSLSSQPRGDAGVDGCHVQGRASDAPRAAAPPGAEIETNAPIARRSEAGAANIRDVAPNLAQTPKTPPTAIVAAELAPDIGASRRAGTRQTDPLTDRVDADLGGAVRASSVVRHFDSVVATVARQIDEAARLAGPAIDLAPRDVDAPVRPTSASLDQARPVSREASRIVTIDLEPKSLGAVRLRFRIRGDQMAIWIEASEVVGAQAIRTAKDALSEIVSSAGLRAVEFVVSHAPAASTHAGAQVGGDPSGSGARHGAGEGATGQAGDPERRDDTGRRDRGRREAFDVDKHESAGGGVRRAGLVL